MKLKISCLIPNHFDQEKIDKDLVARLRLSFRATYEEQGLDGIVFVVRKSPDKPGYFEMVDGKHSRAAIEAEFGDTTEVSAVEKNISDNGLLVSWLHRLTARRKATDDELRRIVLYGEGYMVAHPEVCPIAQRYRQESKNVTTISKRQEHRCPTQECLAKWLRIPGLSAKVISELFRDSKLAKDDTPPPPAPPTGNHAAIPVVSKDEAAVRELLHLGPTDSLLEAFKTLKARVTVELPQGDSAMAAKVLELTNQVQMLTKQLEETKKPAGNGDYNERVVSQMRNSEKGRVERKLKIAKFLLPPTTFQGLLRDHPLEFGNALNEEAWDAAMLEASSFGAK
jgi:hypothetical protein